jgi:hypothetical protein
VATELLENGHKLVKQDGSDTRYATLVQKWTPDPLRVSLAVATYAATWKATGHDRFLKAAESLAREYWEILGFPKVKLMWWEKKNDTQRAALHLRILRQASWNDKVTDRCDYGLWRIWNMERKAMDPWIAGLCAPGITDGEALRVVPRLFEYEVEEKNQQVERLNSARRDYWRKNGVRFIVWDGKWRASQPLPFWMMGSQDFFPERDLFSIDNWTGETDRRLRHNGADFLCSYWINRVQGAVGPEE